MFVPEIERKMGIEVYATKTPGVGGAIRRAVEDFVVEETLVDGSRATAQQIVSKPALGATESRQRFLICVLVKRNWDTFIAIKNVAKELGIGQERIQIAGIKDAKAVTAQYVTIEGVSAQEAATVDFKDVALHPVGYFHEQLCSFYLLGNNFKITIKEIDPQKSNFEERIADIADQFVSAGGIPNFYGHQRFGTTRAITHLVGRAMVQGNMEEAAMIFLGKPSIHEHPESRRIRGELEVTKNFQKALKDFPTQLRFERLMLSYLVANPGDFAGAFGRLPLKLQLLFVQAWQSYLFNRFLSARVKAGFSLGKAEVGDFVVGVERSGLPMVRVSRITDSSNISEINGLIMAGKMRVALPIYGAKQHLSGGVMGELEQQILEEECVDADGFRLSAMPEMRAKGELRAVVCPVRNFKAEAASVEADGKVRVGLEFMLLRGAYATVLLREIIKTKDLVKSGF